MPCPIESTRRASRRSGFQPDVSEYGETVRLESLTYGRRQAGKPDLQGVIHVSGR